MKKPTLFIVDVQNHFKSTPSGEFDNTYDFEKLVENLKKNYKDYGNISVVADLYHVSDRGEENLVMEFQENHFEDFEDDEEFSSFMDRNIGLIEMNVDFELIKVLDTLVENGEIPNVEIHKKEYGSLRGMMEFHVDYMFYIIELKRILGYRELEDVLEEGDELIEKILFLLEDEQGIDKSEVEDLINDGEFDSAEYIEPHYASCIMHEKDIVMAGGGTMECLLEEFINIKGGTSIPSVSIEYSLVYGESHELESTVDTLVEQLSNIERFNQEIENVSSNENNLK